MRKTIGLVAVLALFAMAADVQAKAKEKANKTKCTNKLDNIGSSGQDGVARPAAALIPTMLSLREQGREDEAWQLTEVGVAQTRHRGHRTVLKLAQTVEQCVAKMQRDGDSDEDIGIVRRTGDTWIIKIQESTQAYVDSFFDIWTDVR